MTASVNEQTGTTRVGIAMEYETLRDEILKRIELRQQLVSITLTIAAVFLGFGTTTSSVALVYPLLSAFLAVAWHQNDLRIGDLSEYIRNHIEPAIPGLGWETDAKRKRAETQGTTWRVFSHGGIFLLSQLLAVGIGLVKFSFTVTDWALLGLSITAVLFVIWIMSRELGVVARER